MILAALGHDLDHPGVNNAYLNKTKDVRSLIYNEKSPLENHHCSLLWQILSIDQFNVLENLDKANNAYIKSSVVEAILDTDMVHHQANIDKFADLRVFLNQHGAQITDEHRRRLLSTLIHSADIGNPILKYEHYIKWGYRVVQEFKDQYEAEEYHLGAGSPMFKYNGKKGVF